MNSSATWYFCHQKILMFSFANHNVFISKIFTGSMLKYVQGATRHQEEDSDDELPSTSSHASSQQPQDPEQLQQLSTVSEGSISQSCDEPSSSSATQTQHTTVTCQGMASTPITESLPAAVVLKFFTPSTTSLSAIVTFYTVWTVRLRLNIGTFKKLYLNNDSIKMYCT